MFGWIGPPKYKLGSFVFGWLGPPTYTLGSFVSGWLGPPTTQSWAWCLQLVPTLLLLLPLFLLLTWFLLLPFFLLLTWFLKLMPFTWSKTLGRQEHVLFWGLAVSP